MPDPKLDDMLLSFLERDQQAANKGITLEKVYSAAHTVMDRQTEHEQKDEDRHSEIMGRLISHDRRIVGLEKDVEHLTKDVDRVEENTGKHNTLDLLQAASALQKAPTSIRPRSDPPKNGLTKMIQTAAATSAGRVVGVLLGAFLIWLSGWFSHHIQIGWTSIPAGPAAPSAAETKH